MCVCVGGQIWGLGSGSWLNTGLELQLSVGCSRLTYSPVFSQSFSDTLPSCPQGWCWEGVSAPPPLRETDGQAVSTSCITKLILPPVKVKVAQSCLTRCDPMGYTVHGILQARMLEWVAFPLCRGSSQPRDQTQVSHIAGRFFTS